VASSTPADVLERVLDKGVVIAGDIKDAYGPCAGAIGKAGPRGDS
jgi:hypothetical protein